MEFEKLVSLLRCLCRADKMVAIAKDRLDSFQNGIVGIEQEHPCTARLLQRRGSGRHFGNGRLETGKLDGKAGTARRIILNADDPAMFGDYAITDAEAETGAFADGLCGVEGIKHPGGLPYAGSAVRELNQESSGFERGFHPQIPLAC